MSFYVNLGYTFPLPATVHPSGSVILCSAMPMHQLARRRLDDIHLHLSTRLFDPQLYLAGLDPSACRRHCVILASYPWFGVSEVPAFDSGEQTQAEWRSSALATVQANWPRVATSEPAQIAQAVRECIDFQLALGCAAVVLPAPLTADPTTDYSTELAWLDAGLSYARGEGDVRVPVFATVAISDICVRFARPVENAFLDLVLDVVAARPVDGVYLVLEQASEPGDTRHCGSSLPLASILHLATVFSKDAHLRVGVNFLGSFGLACLAAGAEFWASGWYKSLYRFRIADRMAEGRAYPSYWSHPAATDVHLQSDFDVLARAGVIEQIADETPASAGLLQASRAHVPARQVPAWRYAQSNVRSTQEHFLLSSVRTTTDIETVPAPTRASLIESWLSRASAHAERIASTLGPAALTRTAHVVAWRDAFQIFLEDHAP